MNAPELLNVLEDEPQTQGLLSFYEAIEHASQDMLDAARAGDWDTVVRLEGACAVLIGRLKQAAADRRLGREEAALKSRIMQRILLNDSEIRNLAEPWINDLGRINGHPDGGHLH